jgi:hypothetical protein
MTKITIDRSAAQQALEALFALRALIRDDALACSCQTLGQYRTALLQTIDCATLAQQDEPVQEPVAWRFRETTSKPWSISEDGYYISCKRDSGYIIEPLYTAPPQRKPMTVTAT